VTPQPQLGFGTATLGREVNEDDSLRLLDAAFELGIRHFDTAEAYGGGNAQAYRRAALGIDDVREKTSLLHSSELLLGRWLRRTGVRREVEIATKTLRAGDAPQALAASLHRLGLDHVDIFYLHAMPAQLDAPLSALHRLREEGLTRHYGFCNCTPAHLAQAPHVAYCQNPFNLVQGAAQAETLAYCAEKGVRFVAYSPLAAGFLTGKYGAGEQVPAGSRFDVIPGHQDLYFQDEAYAALAKLKAQAAQRGTSTAQLALEWVWREPRLHRVLIGATKPEQLAAAVRASQANTA